MDGNKWCDNKVEARDVYCGLKALHGCQQRAQIVMSVCKVGWMTITQMPCDNTHNRAWRVAHQISLHAHNQWTGGNVANETQWAMCMAQCQLHHQQKADTKNQAKNIWSHPDSN